MDIPNIRRCCFCIPLRYGLLVWAYIDMLRIIYGAFLLFMNIGEGTKSIFTGAAEVMFRMTQALNGVYVITGTTFNIVLILGTHMKNPKLLRVYYKFTIFHVVLQITAFILTIAVLICFTFENWLTEEYRLTFVQRTVELTITGIGMTLFIFYLMVLVKSEIAKLENNAQLSFMNHVTEPECVMAINEQGNESA